MIELAKKALQETGSKIDLAALLAFMEVESGGKGFDPKTGKIMIQFEPLWFSKLSGILIDHANTFNWDENKVDVQPNEWKAFNEAFSINANAAMESTSIGLPQIMGFHWKRLQFDSVGAMWDYFKVSEINQVKALIKFIETDKSLIQALTSLNWDKVASIYNGKGYKALALKLKREPYNITMARAYNKYKGKGL
jgi:N-acetylmuramidase